MDPEIKTLEVLSTQERREVAARMRSIAADSEDDRRAWRFRTEAERFEKCGLESMLLLCEADNQKFETRICCKSRICDDCGRSYYAKVQGRFGEIVKLMMANKRKGYFCSLLTLTVTTDRFGGRSPDRSDIARFYKESSDWLRLFCGRYRGVFTKKGKVREDRKRWIGAGSISAVEVGHNNNNLHLHAVVYMPFTPASVMRAAWTKITGDSYRVQISPARSVRNVVNYILKYISKPPATDSYADLADYAWMIKGTRRLRSTGMFYNHLAAAKKKKLNCRCPYCSGRLVPAGIVETAHLEGATKSLWKLLRKVEDLGKNLLAPDYRLGQGWVDWQLPVSEPVAV